MASVESCTFILFPEMTKVEFTSRSCTEAPVSMPKSIVVMVNCGGDASPVTEALLLKDRLEIIWLLDMSTDSGGVTAAEDDDPLLNPGVSSPPPLPPIYSPSATNTIPVNTLVDS